MTAVVAVPWEVWTIVLPLAAAIVVFLCGPRGAPCLGVITACGLVLVVAGLGWQAGRYGPARHALGGWQVPLGIALYADGLSTSMLIMAAVVGLTTSVYAVGYFHGHQQTAEEAYTRAFFWPLWLFMWAALNALFLAADIFNLYVTLELLGLAAVALVALGKTPSALTAAMRYLLVALLGSLAYLLGVALLYAAYGTLDLMSLRQVMAPGPPTWIAMALMTAGLVLKTALFPLHFWLPPAHANAPAPVSAVLSALVVKASFYVLLRLWFDVFAALPVPFAGQMLGGLGAAAILWGSLQALRQYRLKLLIAYSTVAQLGYLFLVFFLATQAAGGAMAWQGSVLFALSHACAKAAAFMAAGIIMHVLGHDDIDKIHGVGQHLPVTVFAFALAGVSLMGLPPSGGFVAKWLLLNAALESRQWWLAGVISTGSLLAGGYVFRVLRLALATTTAVSAPPHVSRSMEWVVLGLALGAVVLGCVAPLPLALLQSGTPVAIKALAEVAP
jgi:formate hydrogenlyase subunit 3/multisubunit Na+/H+ antiporter MnhD subunit